MFCILKCVIIFIKLITEPWIEVDGMKIEANRQKHVLQYQIYKLFLLLINNYSYYLI